MSLIDEVLRGDYEQQHLTEPDVTSACDWIAKEAVLKVRGEREFYSEWKNAERAATNGFYLSLVYYCCCTLLDYHDFDSASVEEEESVLKFCNDLINFVKRNDPDSPLRGGVKTWSRQGDIHRKLGDKETAHKIYSEGISTLTRLSSWESGQLIGREQDFGKKYSSIEILYAKKGRVELEMDQYSTAAESLKTALRSLRQRGLQDMKNDSFPNGIRQLHERAKSMSSNVSEESNQSQNAGSSINAVDAKSFIQELSEFGGHSAKVEVRFSSQEGASNAQTHSTLGYLMFRTPESHGHWGVVVKGSEDKVAVLLKVEDRFQCLLYDQERRENITQGEVSDLKIEFTTTDRSFSIDSSGYKK